MLRKLLSVISLALVLVMAPVLCAQTITVTTGTTYQTMTGWEGTAQIGWGDIDGANDIRHNWRTWRDPMVTNLLDLGINRIRVEVRSGIENSTDYFQQFLDGQVTAATYSSNRYTRVNDNADANSRNDAGFAWASLDYQMRGIAIPLKNELAKRGETLHLNICFVDFDNAAQSLEYKSSPTEYGELVLATYDHLNSVFGWTPDTWEVILEPDAGSASWSAQQTADCIVDARSRLLTGGYTPSFIAPSCTNAGNVAARVDTMESTTNAMTSLSEISYHLYSGATTANRNAIRTEANNNSKKTSMLELIGASRDTLHEDLVEANASAWQQFTFAYLDVVSDDGAQYFRVTFNLYTPTISWGSRSRYLRQYFKYIRKNAIRVEASSGNGNLKPTSFKNINDRYVVILNASAAVTDFTVGGLPDGCYGIEYSTGSTPVANADQCITTGNITTTIPAAGVMAIFWKKDNTGCSYSLPDGSSKTFTFTGGTHAIRVSTSAGCKWTAESSDASVAQIVSGFNGTGNGVVLFNAIGNPTASPKNATLTIGGQTFSVTVNNP